MFLSVCEIPKFSIALADYLTEPDHSLVKQVNEHYLPEIIPSKPAPPKSLFGTEPSAKAFDNWLNVDGFGMVWYTPTFSGKFLCLQNTNLFTIQRQSTRLRTSFRPQLTEFVAFASPPADGAPVPQLHPAQYRTIQPPINDSNFRSICANSSSKVVLAHIRATSGAGVVANNNHPFIFGIHTFMHNGMISSFEGMVKRRIIDIISHEAYDHIQGTTDSEHFAALFMTYLCPNNTIKTPNPDATPEAKPEIPVAWEEDHSAEQMKVALLQTIKAIIQIQREVLGKEAMSNFFNIAVTDGNTLVACRYRNHPKDPPTSLYYSTTAGTTLDSRYPGDPDGSERQFSRGGRKLGMKPTRKVGDHAEHVIIASEPSTRDENEWNLVKRNSMLLAEGGRLLGIEPMPLDDDFNVPEDSFN